jgi:Protein of unknown function (DUF3040)
MALSMDEQRMLAEIERRLADDDPVLAARLTSFRLPRLTLATRSARSRLMTSLLMLVVVGVVAVFVYALIPFRGQAARMGTAHATVPHSTASSPGPAKSAAGQGQAAAAPAAGSAARTPAQLNGPATGRSGPSAAYGK